MSDGGREWKREGESKREGGEERGKGREKERRESGRVREREKKREGKEERGKRREKERREREGKREVYLETNAEECDTRSLSDADTSASDFSDVDLAVVVGSKGWGVRERVRETKQERDDR